MKVADYYYNHWYPSCQRRLRTCTCHNYDVQWRKRIEGRWGACELDDITVEEVEDWLYDMEQPGVAASTWRVMKIMLRQARRYGYAERDITPDVIHVPHTGRSRKKVVLDDEGIRKHLEAFRGTEYEALVTLMLTLGLRREEAFALEWGDIDLDTGAVRIYRGLQWVGYEDYVPPKSATSRRTCHLPQSSLERLREIAGGPGDRIVGDMPIRDISRRYRGKCHELGIQYCTLQNLRHSYATSLIRNGVPIKTVSQMLGHSDIQVTLRHYVVTSDDDKKAAQGVFDSVMSGGEVSRSSGDITVDGEMLEKFVKILENLETKLV